MLGATPVTARCPACGGLLAATGTPYAMVYVRCPHCGTAVPIVGPRDPPPLFAWEVSPHLYPPVPALSEGGRRSVRPFVLVTLVIAALITAILVGIVAVDAARALAPGRIDLGGTLTAGGAVIASTHPFAHLEVRGENGFSVNGTDAPDGTFLFHGVPRGAVSIFVNATGYPNTSFVMFFSPIYSAPAQSTSIDLYLGTGTLPSSVTVVYSPFGSLEELVATLLTAGVVFAVGVGMAGAGAWAIVRQRRPGLAVAGAAAMIASPICLPLLTLDGVLPDALAISAAASALGAAAFVLLVIPIALTASAPDE